MRDYSGGQAGRSLVSSKVFCQEGTPDLFAAWPLVGCVPCCIYPRNCLYNPASLPSPLLQALMNTASWGMAPPGSQPRLWRWRVAAPSAPSPAVHGTPAHWTSPARRGAGVSRTYCGGCGGCWQVWFAMKRTSAHVFPATVYQLACSGCRQMCLAMEGMQGMSSAAYPVMRGAGRQSRPSHAAAGAKTEGAGVTSISSVPAEAAPGHTFQALSAGRWHTCGIDQLGRASCWGELGFHGDFLCCSFHISIPSCQPNLRLKPRRPLQ